MADPTSAAVSKQTEFVVGQPADAVSKQTEFVVQRPILGVSKQVEFVVQTPLQAVSKQVEFIVVGPLPPETLTLTGAAYNAGTLTVVGACENAPLSILGISTNNGVSFAAVSSLTVSGSVPSQTYTATLLGVLAPATYDLVAQDTATSVNSAPYPFTITPPEAIAIDSASYNLAGTLTINGDCENAELTGVNISIDDGATFAAASGYTGSGTLFTATLNIVLDQGTTYPLVVEDATTLLQSGAFDLTTQSLTLAAYSYANGTLTLGGFSNETVSAMNVSVDGNTPVAATTFSFSGGAYIATLVGTILPGSHPIYVEDAVTTLESNTQTLIIGSAANALLTTMLSM